MMFHLYIFIFNKHIFLFALCSSLFKTQVDQICGTYLHEAYCKFMKYDIF